ncbi:MAG: hypothetical protein ACOX2L_04780 [Anaerolineae bacterium]|jgi:uncharacterized Zn finger protein
MTSFSNGIPDRGQGVPLNGDVSAEVGRTNGSSGRAEHSWWAGRWMRSLAHVLDANRISEGRACARAGRVTRLEVQPGLVLADVQVGAGGGQLPQRVRLVPTVFSEAQWDRISSLLSQRAIYAAQLMNGEMPEDIDQVFQSVGVSLFPTGIDDLGAQCSCSEWPSACRHIVAVYCQLAEQVDQDPFLLFTMRGRTKEQIMAALRDLRAGQWDTGSAPVEQADPAAVTDPKALPTALEEFWRLDGRLEDIQYRIALPEIDTELLKVLGELSFVEQQGIRARLGEIYRRVSQRALDLAYAEPTDPDHD